MDFHAQSRSPRRFRRRLVRSGSRIGRCPVGRRSWRKPGVGHAERQPCCEMEIVPSLHSNLADAASATAAGFPARRFARVRVPAPRASPKGRSLRTRDRSRQQCLSAFDGFRTTAAADTDGARCPECPLSIQRPGVIRISRAQGRVFDPEPETRRAATSKVSRIGAIVQSNQYIMMTYQETRERDFA